MKTHLHFDNLTSKKYPTNIKSTNPKQIPLPQEKRTTNKFKTTEPLRKTVPDYSGPKSASTPRQRSKEPARLSPRGGCAVTLAVELETTPPPPPPRAKPLRKTGAASEREGINYTPRAP